MIGLGLSSSAQGANLRGMDLSLQGRHCVAARTEEQTCCQYRNFLRDNLETAPLCLLHGKPVRESIAENYQLAFLTPGISPLYASSRKQIRQTP